MTNDTTPRATIFLMGPTASGKSDLAVRLAERLPIDIISADSAMVYRGLDIGSAKPDAPLRRRIPHAMIDICDPSEDFSVAEFRTQALAHIRLAHSRRRHALIVGGTSLYFRALEFGLSELPARQPAFRRTLQNEANERGWLHLHERLAKIDPESAARIHRNDAKRIERALEIHAVTGQTPTALRVSTPETVDLPGRLLKFVTCPNDRSALHARIERRLHTMVQTGFVSEVENLFARPELDENKPAMRAVGYRQIWQAIAAQDRLATGVERAVIATRQLAKRQLTWLRRQHEARWFDGNMATIEKVTEAVTQELSDHRIYPY